MSWMFATRPTVAGAMPRGLRVALNALIILGVFAMHHLLLGPDGEAQPHHEMRPVSAAVSGNSDAGAIVSTEVDNMSSADGLQGIMSDCGGPMALCLGMILGVSAYIVLRKRVAERVLWQLSRPAAARPFPVGPPFDCRSPLERSSVLRC